MIESETLELLEWPRLCHHLATFAATKLGAMAAHQLSIPSTQADTEQLLAQTQEIVDLENRLSGGLSFEGIYDIGNALERSALQGILTGDELLQIATTLAGVRRLRRSIDNQTDVPVLQALVEPVRTYPEIEQEIHRCIDERGDVADRASVRLSEIRVKLRQFKDRIYQVLQNIMQRQAGALQEQLITQRGDRFVLPVKAPQKDVIRGIVHDTSTSGATLYIEPHAIVEINNQLRLHKRQEQAEEEAICRQLSEQIAAVKPDLEQLLAIATMLDLATARARYSLWLEANAPRFIDRTSQQANEIITLRQLRHPLLVWQQQYEQRTPVVPIDVVIKPEIRVVAITGPNTGGKTVTLKTLGLVALMAKVGLFIPAREPVELPWFDKILADIGDEQSIEQSLSTFSGHIRRISRILEAMSENSLILLDEVGAGTDPSEGSALATAILQYLADTAQLTIATTHYGELKALKYQDAHFENASVEFDDVSLSPTYRLLWGIPGRSNALTIARRLGLMAEIIDQAQANVRVGNLDDVNQVIAGLEAQRRTQETRTQEATELLKQTEKLHRELSQKAAQLQQREQQLKLSQEQAVQAAINEAKAEIAQVIRQLQKGPATAQDAHQATDALNQIAEQKLPSRKAPPKKPKPGFRPQVGDRVRIPRLGQTAEVLTPTNEDGELSVRFGLMKMTVTLADVESLDGQKAEMPVKPKPATIAPPAPPLPTVRTSQNTLDFRGFRVADAEIELERAIAEVATKSGALWIIHGKGTGKLRQGVQEFLTTHPQVSHYELAPSDEGGAGVTVAYLK